MELEVVAKLEGGKRGDHCKEMRLRSHSSLENSSLGEREPPNTNIESYGIEREMAGGREGGR